MIKRLTCLLRGHDFEPVRAAAAVVIPGQGPGFYYEARTDGIHGGCRRCYKVELYKFATDTPNPETEPGT